MIPCKRKFKITENWYGEIKTRVVICGNNFSENAMCPQCQKKKFVLNAKDEIKDPLDEIFVEKHN